jgi:hypothetical protein
MPKFEVYIPAAKEGDLNLTLRVDADNWMAALKTGITRLGEQGTNAQNLLIDIQDDNSLHVTESHSGRVFRIRELTEAESASATVKKSNPPAPASHPIAPAVVPATAPPSLAAVAEAPPAAADHHVHMPAAALLHHHPKQKPYDPSSVVELEHPTLPVIGKVGRARSGPRPLKDELEDVLAEVFERVQEVHSKPTEEAAMYFLLDLALEKIPAESGTVYHADGGSGDLSFVAVRGPKANQLLASKIVVPSGTGLAGFSAAEGVSVAVSDAEKDPRYYRSISEKLGYEVQSILCAPMMTHGRAFGCVQILNKRGSKTFSEHEVGLLSYVAHQAALFLNLRS